MAPILEINNLFKSYGSVEILKDINVAIEQGDFLVLVGPSGCGKSTLLNCIAGLEPITSGKLSIGGQDMTHVNPKDRDIAMVFQSYALYPTMTVAKNITFGMKVRGVEQSVQDEKLKHVATQLQIEPLLHRKPGQLSGGQRQRVAMGRALVRDPKLFLFDEPLSNLEIGTPAEIYNHPANLFVADFMGSPAMNLIPAKTKANGNGVEIEIARETGGPITLIDTKNKNLPKDVIVGVRPEDIADASLRGGEGRQETECLIDIVEPAGADTFAVMQLGGKHVTARLHAETAAVAGQNLKLAFDLGKVSYFAPETGERLN